MSGGHARGHDGDSTSDVSEALDVGPREQPQFHIVGVGASAGGLDSLERLFTHLPADTGMAFVALQHLSPDFKSLVDELLSRRTSMQIRVWVPGCATGQEAYSIAILLHNRLSARRRPVNVKILATASTRPHSSSRARASTGKSSWLASASCARAVFYAQAGGVSDLPDRAGEHRVRAAQSDS